jgi:hypothetical protein
VKEDTLFTHSTVLAKVSRDFLVERKYAEVLAVMARIPLFLGEMPITIMTVYVQCDDAALRAAAIDSFKKCLQLCTREVMLTSSVMWVLKRKSSAPDLEVFESLLNERRKHIQPDWDGVWDIVSVHANDVLAQVVRDALPEHVHDPETCLKVATQKRRKDIQAWVDRYFELGGSSTTPSYLKFVVGRASAYGIEPTDEVRRALQMYSSAAPIEEVRKFLRKIAPTRRGTSVMPPNTQLGRYALLVYASCERIRHDCEDWTHIAKSALYCRHVEMQRIAQRGLAGCRRDTIAQNIFLELTRLHGEIAVTANTKQDIRIRGNPVWDRVYHLIPVNADARKILIVYSCAEMQEVPE